MFIPRKKFEEMALQLEEAVKLIENPHIQKALELKKIEEEKKAAYDRLVKQPYKYEIIKDFIEAAAQGVVVRFTVDGVPIEIRKDETKQQDRFSSATF